MHADLRAARSSVGRAPGCVDHCSLLILALCAAFAFFHTACVSTPQQHHHDLHIPPHLLQHAHPINWSPSARHPCPQSLAVVKVVSEAADARQLRVQHAVKCHV